MRSFYILTTVVLLAACSSVKVNYDYDPQADFSRYKTYSFTDDARNLEVGELIRGRILTAIEAEMSKKGFTKSETPDMLVDLHVKTAKRTEAVANNVGGGYYGRYGYWGGGMRTTTISYNEYTDGSLFINFIDKGTEKLVWQGVGTKTIDPNVSPQKADANIKYAVESILSKYPPAKK